ncbi:hypothetical protein Tco_1175951 [Tanacetum coccineum]
MLHASGSGDRVGSQPKVPDESQDKTTGTDEGSDSEDDDSNDDVSDDVSKGDDDDTDSDGESDNDASDNERTDSDEEENHNLTLKDEINDDNRDFDEEEYDELYKDVDVKSLDAEREKEGKGDAEMIDADKDVSQERSYNKFLNLDNVPPADNEVASMMNVKVHQEESSTLAPPLLTVHVTAIPETSTVVATTVPPIIQSFSYIPQMTTPTPIPTTEPMTSSIPALPDFASQFEFDQRVSALEQELSQVKQVDHSAQILVQIPTIVDEHLSTRIGFAIQTTLQSYTEEFEKKAQAKKEKYIHIIEKSVKEIIKYEILLDKLEKSKSYRATKQHRHLYDALVKSYQLDKDLFDFYGKAYSLKRGREDKDKDEDPPAGSDQGLKKRKTSKEAEPTKGSKSKESKSSKGTKSQTKISGKSVQAEELMFETTDTEMPQDQGGDLGNTEDQPNVKEASKHDCRIAQAEKPPLTFDELMSTPIDFSAYVLNNLKIENLTQEYQHNPEGHEYPFDLSKPLPLIEDQGLQVVPANYFFNNDLEYLKGGSSSGKYTTSTTKTKAAKYDNIEGIEDMVPTLWSPVSYEVVCYGYLEEIKVRREDHMLYMFKEGDFPILNLRDIKDMLLLLVQKKLSNLDKDDLYDLNVALRMFTRRVVILKQVKDLQLGVESYQKKLNITKPETFRSDISSMIPYTTYNNPQGIIYQYKFKRNRLMHSDELYKFCDGTLTFV